ncbi:glycosyl transferase [Mucilaginibacter gilvus]|uniref:Glycosyl transferase n=1 Tax=Mucilaginibacter gilvus TaxID=2305909 RepID=A0A444MUV0_9SPHI|nr:glycosyl transferase [Mucilaginibacter gilvus]RWY57335.1 glycosyl transferase [Mucilaginibacter gilvus]
MLSGRAMMEKRSVDLPPVASTTGGLPVYFLTGKHYLYQTLYCIQSLAKVSAAKFQFILVDDGTFDNELIYRITTQLPGATIISADVIASNLAKVLPADAYPYIHQKREVYPHLKKLTDVHTLPDNNWKVVLDSDMLFWNEPLELINWLNAPTQPLHMIDCVEAYGYSKQLMERLCGCPVTPLINVGAIGLKSQNIHWAKLEEWIKVLEEQEGASYYLEQALTAMLIGDADATVLPGKTYIVNPGAETIKDKKGILHHYVDLSKQHYFKTAWQEFVKW